MSDSFRRELRIANNFGFLIGGILLLTATPFLAFGTLTGILVLNRASHFMLFNRLF